MCARMQVCECVHGCLSVSVWIEVLLDGVCLPVESGVCFSFFIYFKGKWPGLNEAMSGHQIGHAGWVIIIRSSAPVFVHRGGDHTCFRVRVTYTGSLGTGPGTAVVIVIMTERLRVPLDELAGDVRGTHPLARMRAPGLHSVSAHWQGACGVRWDWSL